MFIMQVRVLYQVETRTEINVDHSDDATFQINFKLELPSLSCEWATIDVIDALGSRHFNISGEGVYKHSMGASRYLGWAPTPPNTRVQPDRALHENDCLLHQHRTLWSPHVNFNTFNPMHQDEYDYLFATALRRGVEHASAGRESQKVPEYGQTTDLDHYGNKRIAYEVSGKTFDRMVRAHQVLLVNFHAPWCSHCQRTAPIFEHAAEVVRSDLMKAGRARLAAGLATVDCTLDVNRELCREQHIQAFPTLRVYRAGSLHPVQPLSEQIRKKNADTLAAESAAAAAAAEKDAESVQPSPTPPADLAPQLEFEAYHGKRTAEDIAEFVRKVLEEVLATTNAKHEEAYEDDYGKAKAAAARVEAGDSAAAAKALGGQIRTSGCIIDGSIRVNRVPGSFYVTAHSKGHNMNPDLINMTHTIKHLSFGKHVPGRPSYIPRSLRHVWAKIPKDMGGRFAAGNASTFASEDDFTVHEHYLKIVSRKYEPIVGDAVQLYEYTFNSNRFKLMPPFSEDDHNIDGPMIKFSYDISPMSVVLREITKPRLEWALGMCALLGGVYTCSSLLENVVQTSVRTIKRNVGKLS